MFGNMIAKIYGFRTCDRGWGASDFKKVGPGKDAYLAPSTVAQTHKERVRSLYDRAGLLGRWG